MVGSSAACPPAPGESPSRPLLRAGDVLVAAFLPQPLSLPQLLGVLQPSDNSQVLPGATVEPDTQPSQACSDICAAPETSPGTQHPPGSAEMEPVRGWVPLLPHARPEAFPGPHVAQVPWA